MRFCQLLFRKKNSRLKSRFAISCFFWLRSCGSGHITKYEGSKEKKIQGHWNRTEYSTKAAAIKSALLFWQAMAENKHNTHIYIHYTTSISYIKMKTGILTTKRTVLLKYTKHWKVGRNQPQYVVYPSSSPISSHLPQLSMYRTFLH